MYIRIVFQQLLTQCLSNSFVGCKMKTIKLVSLLRGEDRHFQNITSSNYDSLACHLCYLATIIIVSQRKVARSDRNLETATNLLLEGVRNANTKNGTMGAS